VINAIIEIPKGDSIRRYYNKSENKFVEIGQIKDVIPVNDGIMPVNYGFTPEAHNPNDNNALDVLVISNNTLTVGQELEVSPIAILKRKDGDDKIVAVENNLQIQSWENLEEDLKNLLLSFFGYKSGITEIGSKEEAQKYIENLRSNSVTF
jgi:inorganic pyrophosphatase